ncbi:MAG: hypothetical protein HY066_01215 [Betaproteobacteria bacterium]|nr:hypothetical protein [Betaproteobacteria bacterium]
MIKPSSSLNLWAIAFALPVLLAGCAAPLPVPFQLVDASSNILRGTLFPDNQRIEANIDGHQYSGFYITAGGNVISHTMPGRWFYPSDTITTYSSNSARAYLVSDDGKRLSCEFLLESRHAVGECRSAAGAKYQLVADGN